MFLGRADEARDVYIGNRDKTWPDSDNKPWNAVILDDFRALRDAGITHPMMSEIETLLK